MNAYTHTHMDIIYTHAHTQHKRTHKHTQHKRTHKHTQHKRTRAHTHTHTYICIEHFYIIKKKCIYYRFRNAELHNAVFHNAECRLLNVVMLNVVAPYRLYLTFIVYLFLIWSCV